MAKASKGSSSGTGKAKAAPRKPASAADALVEEAMKKQEIAKAIAISRAADFTGESGSALKDTPTPNPSPTPTPLGGGGAGAVDAKSPSSFRGEEVGSVSESPSPLRGGARGGGNAALKRRPPLAGQEALGAGVRVAMLPPADRISLRCRPDAVPALSKALDVPLPTKPKSSASANGRTALWLGPDEWLVIDETGNDPLDDCASVKALHSAVGISHRNAAISVVGPNAGNALAAGCPQDLSLAVFPVGACSRTILGKVEIVVLRTAEDAFRVECWRSFSDYVFAFLADAAKDAAA